MKTEKMQEVEKPTTIKYYVCFIMDNNRYWYHWGGGYNKEDTIRNARSSYGIDENIDDNKIKLFEVELPI